MNCYLNLKRPFNVAIFSFVAVFILALSAFNPESVQATSVCPFCSAINLTFAEQIKANDVVVVARLINQPPLTDDIDAELPKAEFSVKSVIKGQDFVATEMKFKTLLVGRYDKGQEFLVMGVDPPRVSWSTPIRASERVFKYLNEVVKLPKDGADRLAFFQDYFEDEESILAFDAYDEFANAPYDDLIALKPRMKRDQLKEWIANPKTSVDRRRLYFVMLSVCGQKEDAEFLESFIKSGDRKKQAGLDALVTCYLALKGDAGVDLIEEMFLKGTEPDYVDTLSAISALRFHATELEVVSRDRIVKAVRNLLDRPKMADMIIPDLARWEDWSVMDRLVKMFKEADEETNWLRVPVITYLRACPKPEAQKYIEELAKIDPDAVKRADFFLDFDSDDDDDDDDDDEEDGDEEDGDEESANVDPKEADSDTDDERASEANGEAKGGLDQAHIKARSANDIRGVSELTNISTSRPVYLAKRIPLDDSQAQPPKSNIPVEDVDATNQTQEINVETSDGDSLASESGSTATFAVAPGAVPALQSVGSEGSADVEQVALAPQPVPVAAAQTDQNLMTRVIFLPMLASFLIFLLLWCVINGWFERLIF